LGFSKTPNLLDPVLQAFGNSASFGKLDFLRRRELAGSRGNGIRVSPNSPKEKTYVARCIRSTH
jgi:hypothetical protein